LISSTTKCAISLAFAPATTRRNCLFFVELTNDHRLNSQVLNGPATLRWANPLIYSLCNNLRWRPLVMSFPAIDHTRYLHRFKSQLPASYREGSPIGLRYMPVFPERFGLFEHARNFMRQFFHAYNTEHCHTG